MRDGVVMRISARSASKELCDKSKRKRGYERTEYPLRRVWQVQPHNEFRRVQNGVKSEKLDEPEQLIQKLVQGPMHEHPNLGEVLLRNQQPVEKKRGDAF